MRLAKVFYFFTCALGLFPILKLNHFSILMIIWFILACINAFNNKSIPSLNQKKHILLILSFWFLMYVAYLPFATDFKELGKSISKSLPFVVFSVGFLLNKELVTKPFVRTIGTVFITSVSILNVLGWVKVVQFGWSQAWHQNNFYDPVFRNLFFNATSLHLPYLGLLSVFASLWLTYRMLSAKRIKVISSVVIAFLLISTYIYSARMALICYLIGVLFMILKSIEHKTIKWSLFVGLPILAIFFVWFSPLKERYVKTIEKEMVLPNANQEPHEVNYRYGIWHCSKQLISNHFFTGVGADKVQQKLNNCYSDFTYKSYEDFTKVTYNTHNQYFDQLLKFGIIGLLLFIVALFYFFRGASILYQTFIIVTAISFLTENILDRQIGVVFFSLLNTIFVILKINTFEKSTSSRLVR